MIVTTHQPIFFPWPGFFHKAIEADCIVLLDDVQFPRGRGWLNRNRLKNKMGEMWLRIPVRKKGRGLQIIRNVEICDETNWRKNHLQSIIHNYTNAPYLGDYFPRLEYIYSQNDRFLIDLNVSIIKFFLDVLEVKTELVLQSELGVRGKASELVINICEHLGSESYLNFPIVEKYLDIEKFLQSGINFRFSRFTPPVYP